MKLGQRFYDPSLGRWTQQDPIPNGNLYVYTGDNPVNFIDVTGTDSVTQTVANLAFNVGNTAAAVAVSAQGVAFFAPVTAPVTEPIAGLAAEAAATSYAVGAVATVANWLGA